MASPRKKLTNDTKMRISKQISSPIKSSFIQSIPNKRLFLTAPLLSTITIALVLILHPYLPPEVPLFYGLPESEEQLASAFSLVVPSVISLVVFVVNGALLFLLDDSFLENTLVVATFAVSIISSITTIKIIILINSFLLL